MFAGLLKKSVLFAAALGAVIGGFGTLVVALSFAVYAALRDVVGPAWASAITALAAAVITLGVAFVLIGQTRGKKPADRHADHKRVRVEDLSPMDRAIEMARERPLLAAGGAVAIGLLAFRNPALINTLVGIGAARSANPPARR